jgi:hypothetical protein
MTSAHHPCAVNLALSRLATETNGSRLLQGSDHLESLGVVTIPTVPPPRPVGTKQVGPIEAHEQKDEQADFVTVGMGSRVPAEPVRPFGQHSPHSNFRRSVQMCAMVLEDTQSLRKG